MFFDQDPVYTYTIPSGAVHSGCADIVFLVDCYGLFQFVARDNYTSLDDMHHRSLEPLASEGEPRADTSKEDNPDSL